MAVSTGLPRALSGQASVVYSTYVYMIGGVDGSRLDTVYFAPLNPDGTVTSTGTWTAATKLPAVRESPSAVIHSARMYVLGGNDSGGSAANTAWFAPIASSGTVGGWSATVSLPQAARYHSSVVYSSRVYVVGGNGVATSSYVYVAPILSSGTLGAWSQTASLPLPREKHASVVFNNKLYAIGGYEGGSAKQEVYYASIDFYGNISTWTATSSLSAARSFPGALVFNNRIYAIGGEGVSSVEMALMNANGSLGAWNSSQVSLPQVRGKHASAVFNNFAYVFGGLDDLSADRAEIFIASFTLGGIALNTHKQLDITLSAGASDYVLADASPNRVEVFTSMDCAGGLVYDSGWIPATSANTGATLSTATANYVRVRGRDAQGNEGWIPASAGMTGGAGGAGMTGGKSEGCFGPYYPADNRGPLGPAIIQPAVDPSTWTLAVSSNIAAKGLNLARGDHASVVYGSYVYVTGGNDGGGARSEVYFAPIFSDGKVTSTGSWTQTTSLPAARERHGAVIYNSRLYVIGGLVGGSASQDIRFAAINANGTLDAWSQASMPAARDSHASVWIPASAGMTGGALYVIGGKDAGGTARADVFYAAINADGSLGAWHVAKSLPQARSGHSALVFHNRIYVLGDSSGLTPYFALIAPDGTLGDWKPATNLAAAFSYTASAAANNRLYVIGGVGRNEVYSAAVSSSGALGAWNAMTALPQARERHSAVVLNNRLYVIGGYAGAAYRSDILVSTFTLQGVTFPSAGQVQAALSAEAADEFNGSGTPNRLEVYSTFDCSGTPLVQSGWGNTPLSAAVPSNTPLYVGVRGRDNAGNEGWIPAFAGMTGGAGGSIGGCFGPYTSGDLIPPLPPTISQGAVDPSTWTLAVSSSLPAARTDHATVVYSSYGYVIGGYDGAGAKTEVYFAAIGPDGKLAAGGSWTATTALSAARRLHSAVVSSSYVFVTGGGTAEGSPSNTVFSAPINTDGTLGSWNNLTPATPLPSAREKHASVVFGGNLFVTGGNNSGAQTTVFSAPIYSSGTLGAWTTLGGGSSLPAARHSHASIVVSSFVYAVGGYGTVASSYVYVATVFSSGTVGSWTQTTSLPEGHYGHRVLAFNNRLYALGGKNASDADSADVYSAAIGPDGVLGSWTTQTALAAVRTRHSAIAFNNRAYVIGGDAGGASAAVWAASFTVAGITSPDYRQLNFVFSQGAQDAVQAHANPNKIELFQNVLCTGTAVYDSDWFSGASHLATNLSTAAAHYAAVLGRDAAGNISDKGDISDKGKCFGPYDFADNFPPLPPTLAVIEPSTWTLAVSSGLGATGGPLNRHWHTSVVYSSFVYLIGGDDGTNPHADVYFAPINPDGTITSTGSWIPTSGLPTTKTRHTSVIFSSWVYTIGGANGGAGTDVNFALISSSGPLGAWNPAASLPAGRSEHASVVFSSRVYVIGGNNDATVYFAQFYSSGTLGAWTQTTSLPENRRSHRAIVFNNRLYVMGGIDSTYSDKIYFAPINADGALGAWTELTATPIPGARVNFAAVVFNNRLYVAGGANASVQSSVYSAPIYSSGTLGAWRTSLPGLPDARESHSWALFNNRFYLIGGRKAGFAARSDIDVITASFTLTGIEISAAVGNKKMKIDLSASADDAYGDEPNPNKVEVHASKFCEDAAVYDSGWSNLTSFTTPASLSTDTAHYVKVKGRDAAGNEGWIPASAGMTGGWSGCFGPYYPQDNAPPIPPAITMVEPSTWTVAVSSNIGSAQSPQPRSLHASVVYSSYVYVIGGNDVSGTAHVEVYFAALNPDGVITSTGSWIKTTSLPNTRRNHSSVVFNNRIYVIGGANGGGQYSTVYFAAISSSGTVGGWNTTTSLPVVLSGAKSIVFNNRVYVIGGWDGVGAAMRSEVYVAPINPDGTLGQWTQTASLPVTVSGQALVVFNRRVYVIGGWDGAVAYSNVYVALINPDGT
ncbi:MAG: hypothetical protein HY611_05755, partial [Elusimicrobia bacterium]|nr:hypothetical protein [Elusimicrobiota bacterium]